MGKQSQLLLKPTEVELGLQVGVEFDNKNYAVDTLSTNENYALDTLSALCTKSALSIKSAF